MSDGSRHENWKKDFQTKELECLSCGYLWTGLRSLGDGTLPIRDDFDLRCPQPKCPGQAKGGAE